MFTAFEHIIRNRKRQKPKVDTSPLSAKPNGNEGEAEHENDWLRMHLSPSVLTDTMEED